MNRIQNIIIASMLMAVAIPTFAQDKQEKKDGAQTANTTAQPDRTASSMLQNAAADNGTPREINIGLPSDIAGTTVMENGIPVTYDNQSLMTNRIWRADGSFAGMQSLNIYKSAIWNGSIGIAMNTKSGRGTQKFGGAATFQTNSFGLIRAQAKISGPLSKNGWTYQLSAFMNYDPTSQHAQFSRFLDKTQLFRLFVNKKNAHGQIGVGYKFINSQGCNQWNMNPYIYHKDGTVSEYNGMDIGTTPYIEKSGMAYPHNAWTGEQMAFDILKKTGTTAHQFDLLGDYTFANKVKFDYSARLLFANSGFANPNTGTLFYTGDQGEKNRYVYANNPSMVYEGPVQKGQMAIAKKWSKWGASGRFEFSKATQNNKWVAGLTESMLDADNAYRVVYATYMTVEPNPTALIHQTYVNGQWTNGKSNKYGAENANSAIQFYDGYDGKTAIYLMDTWKPVKQLTIDLGARLEWQHVDGYWAPAKYRENFTDADGVTTKILTGKESITKNWWNKSFAGNVIWNALRNGGFTADAMYAQIGGNLSNYAQAIDPNVKQSATQAYSAGVFYNGKIIDVTSKINFITRSNYLFAGNFENPNNVTEIERATVFYDVKTLGWTTDINFRPFKGFNLHYLLTIQSPKYDKFDFTLFGDQRFDYTDKTVRSVSKVLMEIDPSYTYKKFRFWGNVRYFSKQYACFSDALYFAARWETFAGIDFKYNKQVSFSLSAVNLLNQTGAQGNIAGANTITEDQAPKYYDKVLAGTFIRPFTLEFKTTVRF